MTTIRSLLATLLLGVASGAVSAAAPPTESNPIPSPTAPTAPAGNDAERQGEELFGRNCQLCHNSRGKGGKGPQLVSGAWGPGGANSDDYMFGVIKNGRANTQMGGFGGSLSDAEIRVVIAFLRAESLRVRAAQQKKVDTDYQPW